MHADSVVKGVSRAELLYAVRTAAVGSAVFGPGVAGRLGADIASSGSLLGGEATVPATL